MLAPPLFGDRVGDERLQQACLGLALRMDPVLDMVRLPGVSKVGRRLGLRSDMGEEEDEEEEEAGMVLWWSRVLRVPRVHVMKGAVVRCRICQDQPPRSYTSPGSGV